jgi:hypothetical protein
MKNVNLKKNRRKNPNEVSWLIMMIITLQYTEKAFGNYIYTIPRILSSHIPADSTSPLNGSGFWGCEAQASTVIHQQLETDLLTEKNEGKCVKFLFVRES